MPYFINIRGKAFGPFDEAALANMKTQGKLSRATEVSENKVDWFPAESLDFLFPAAPSPMGMAGGLSAGGSFPGASSSGIYGTPPTPSAIQEPADWFYSADGKEGFGPVSRSVIQKMLQAGTLQGESLVWQQGQNAQQIKSVPAFSSQGGLQQASPFSGPAPQQAPTRPPQPIATRARQQQQQQQQQQQSPPGASMFCAACGNPVVTTAQICPRCGSPIVRHGANPFGAGAGQKSRMVYILLALFFGGLGIHNFYAGRNNIGIVQLILGLTFIGLLVTGIWAIIDAIAVSTDGQGQPMV